MKNRVQLYTSLMLSLILTFLVSSCDLESFDIGIVEFDKPQPQHKNLAQTFKKKWHGKYYAIHGPEDGFIINEDGIKKLSFQRKRIHKNELFEEFKYTGDLEDNKQVKTWLEHSNQTVNIKGDSIYLIKWNVDESKLGFNTYLLKYYKGQYYINLKEKDKWGVFQLSYVKGDTLKMGAVFENEALEKYDFVIKHEHKNKNGKIIDIDYTICPNKKQFKQLLIDQVFEPMEYYVKIND